MANIGIIGWGVVGQATGKGFVTNKENKVLWYDKYKDGGTALPELLEKSEFIFIAVPTPIFSDYSGLDVSIVDSVVGEVAPALSGTDKILVIKSTVLPGSTEAYIKNYKGTKFAMNPEFLTQANANKDFLNPERTVIGVTDEKVGERLKKLHQTILPKNQEYFITDPTTAELAKYMSNLMLASKVLLANEFYLMAKKLGIDYEGVREIVEADSRIGTHIKAPGPDGDMGFGGACFPKDMVGLLGLAKELKVDLSALEAIWEKNLKLREKRDWEDMPSAVSRKK